MRVCDRCKQEIWGREVHVGMFVDYTDKGKKEEYTPIKDAAFTVDLCQSCQDTFLKPLIFRVVALTRGTPFTKKAETVEEADDVLNKQVKG